MTSCSFPDCNKVHAAKGYCRTHYSRLKRNGSAYKLKYEWVGYKKHSLYSTWCNMKSRCHNVNSKHYNSYGGRGIKVCDRWSESFPRFVDDMGEKPTSNHTIERINNDGNYEPRNCRWATYREQANNRRLRVDNKAGHKGVAWHEKNKKWIAQLTIDGKHKYIGSYDTIKEAVKAYERATS